jgi:hypothetical protein
LGAKTTGNFAMDHRRSQSPFSDIMGGFNISSVQKHKQMLAVLEITLM